MDPNNYPNRSQTAIEASQLSPSANIMDQRPPNVPVMAQMSSQTTFPAPPSLSPTASSHDSPSMPSSSSSHRQTNPAHSMSPSEANERQIAEARAFLGASMNNIGSSLDRTLQERARNLHDNSKVLEGQMKDIQKGTDGLKKENDKLAKMAAEGSRKVKELGNVQNWAEMLERDFLVLGEWVRLVNGEKSDGASSESSWTDSDGDEHAEGNEPTSLHHHHGTNGVDAGKAFAVDNTEGARNAPIDTNGKRVEVGDSQAASGQASTSREVMNKALELQMTSNEHNGVAVDTNGDSQMVDIIHEPQPESNDSAADGRPKINGSTEALIDNSVGLPVGEGTLRKGDIPQEPQYESNDSAVDSQHEANDRVDPQTDNNLGVRGEEETSRMVGTIHEPEHESKSSTAEVEPMMTDPVSLQMDSSPDVVIGEVTSLPDDLDATLGFKHPDQSGESAMECEPVVGTAADNRPLKEEDHHMQMEDIENHSDREAPVQMGTVNDISSPPAIL